MSRLVRIELLKLRTTRLTYGLLALAAALTALDPVLRAARAGHGKLAPLSTATGLTSVLTVTGFAMIIACVLGVTVSSGEFRHQTATLTKPRSNRPIGSGLGGLLPRLWRVEKLGEEELDALVEEATIDAYGDDEQLSGFAVMIGQAGDALRDHDPGRHDNRQRRHVTQTAAGIVADCVRDGHHQAIHILDLPLPEPPPKGAEWIAACRHWARFA